MKKRVTSILLALCMLLGLLPVPALAAERGQRVNQEIDEGPEQPGTEAPYEVALAARAANSIQTDLAEVERQLNARKPGDYNGSPGLPLQFDREESYVLHYGADIGTRYSYDGHDLKGKGEPATISVSGSGADGAFNHSGSLYHMKAYWPKESLLPSSGGQTQELTPSAVPSEDNRARLCLGEDGSDRFRSSNIGYIPFALSVYVPAQTIKTVRFEFEGSARRESKGAAGYYMELFHWGSTYDNATVNATKFQTGDTAKATDSDYVMTPSGMAPGQRAYWDTKSGGRFKTFADVTYTNDSSDGKWMTEYFGYYTGVGRSSSLLGSYHHKMVTVLNIYKELISTQRLASPVASLTQGTAQSSTTTTTYNSIEEAVEAFNSFSGTGGANGETNTLTLLQDVTPQYGRSKLTKWGTVNLNNHTWSAYTISIASGAHVTFEGGTLEGLRSDWDRFITVDQGGQLLLDTDVTVNYSGPTGNSNGGTAIRSHGLLVLLGSATVSSAGVAVSLYGPGMDNASGNAQASNACLKLTGTPNISGGAVDIELVNGGYLEVKNQLTNTENYTLSIDRRPTGTAPVPITRPGTWYSGTDNPGRWFTLKDMPGCQFDVKEYDATTEKKYQALVRTAQVTLDPDGGSVPGGTTQIPVNEEGKVTGLPTPSKPGSLFAGWFTAKTGGTEVTERTVLDGDATLYARWSTQQLQVSFDLNGGSGAKPDSRTVTYGQAYGTLPTPSTQSYKTFAGWYTEAAGGNLVREDTLVSKTQAHTLYAHWKGASFTLSFNKMNSYASPSSNPASITVTYGEPYGQLPVLTAPGKDFLGWSTSRSGGTVLKAEDLVGITKDTTLYGQWENKSVTVTLDPAEGTVEGETTLTKTYDSRYNLPTPTREGYDFECWTLPDGTKIDDSTKVDIEWPHTLTAKWKPKLCTITYNMGTGNTDDNTTAKQYVGQKLTRPALPDYPGHEFVGWYSDAGFSNPWFFSYNKVREDATLYAKWRETSYSISLHNGGGTFTSGSGTGWYYLTDVTDTSGLSSVQLTKNGYTLLGWVDKDGSKVTASNEPLSGSLVLYPVWKENEYTVTFDANGGSVDPTTKTVAYRQSYGELPTPTNNTDTSLRFAGWFTAADDTGTAVRSTTTMLKQANHTLYAHWEKAHIHYDADGKEIVFTEWTQTDRLPSSGNIYLSSDVTLAATAGGDGDGLRWTTSGDLNVCLNGHTVTREGYSKDAALEVKTGTASIFDCPGANGSGKIFNKYVNTQADASQSRSVIDVRSNATLNLYGGTVTGGFREVPDSGTVTRVSPGVTVESNATFHMYGGEISGNSWKRTGADNQAASQVVANTGATVKLLGGKILQTSDQTGYSVASFGSAMTISDVDISGGDGVYIDENSTLSLGGKTTIDGTYGLYLLKRIQILEGGLSSGSSIKTTLPGMIQQSGYELPAKLPFGMAYSGSDRDAQHFIPSNDKYYPDWNSTGHYLEFVKGTTAPVRPFPGGAVSYPGQDEQGPQPPAGGGGSAETEHKHKPCGETGCTHEGTEETYSKLTGTTLSGAVYLTGNVPGNLTVNAGTVTLCLNGHNITGRLTVSGGTVTICDCMGGGSITTLTATSGGTVNLNGGSISTLNASGGTVNLNGGSAGLKMTGGTVTLDGATVGSITYQSGTLNLNAGVVNSITIQKPSSGIRSGNIVLQNNGGGLTLLGNITLSKDIEQDIFIVPGGAAAPTQPYKINPNMNTVYPFTLTSDWNANKPNEDVNKWFASTSNAATVTKSDGGEVELSAKKAVTVVTPDGYEKGPFTISTKNDKTIDMSLLPTNDELKLFAPVGYLPDGWCRDSDSKITAETTFSSNTSIYPFWTKCEHEKGMVKDGDLSTAPKCFEAGMDVEKCPDCGAVVRTTVSEIGHHTAGSEWKSDETSHWHECTVCGEKFDLGAHTLSAGAQGGTPASCTAPGAIKYHCSDCNQDVNVNTTALGHDFSGAWQHDDSQHWRACARDGCSAEDTANKADHIWAAVITLEPTESAEGTRTLTCICGETKQETIPQLKKVPGVPETAADSYNATFVYGPHQNPSEIKGTKAGVQITVPTPNNRTGFTFQRWNWFALSTLASGTMRPGSYTMPASNVVFTAQWKQNDRTTLNPGEEIILDDGTKIKNDDGEVTIDRDGDGTPDTTVTPPKGTDTVDVVHKDDGKDVIELPGGSEVKPDPNGPAITVGGPENPSDKGEVDMDGNVTLPDGSTITDGDGTKITVDKGPAKVEPDGSTTLPEGGQVTITGPGGTDETEITVDPPQEGEEPPVISTELFTVTFDGNGHGDPVPAKRVYSGGKLAKPVVDPVDGWTLEGWYITYDPDVLDEGEAAEQQWDFDTGRVLSDMTLKAKWTQKGASKTPTVTGPTGSSTDGLKEGEIPTGDSAPKLSVTVTDPAPGDSTITYQWYEKDENGEWKPIPGAAGPEYTIPENTPAGKHEYVCEVTNQEPDKNPSTVRTDPITVTVSEPEHVHDWGNWAITKAPTLTETGTAERVCKSDPTHRESKTLPVLTDTSVWTPGARVEPTPTKDGSQTYESEYGNVTITLPAAGHEHKWSDRWSNDALHHWHECTGAGTCDATNETEGRAYGNHAYNIDQDTVCYVCGYDWTNASKAPTVTGPTGSNTDGLKESEIPTGDGAPKLSVTVTDPAPGDSTITYQWFGKDENGEWKPIPGTTGPEYTIPENTPAGKHEYVCEVTNSEPDKNPSTVRTDPITVTVGKPEHVHDWGNWTITKAPTLTETGTAERVCKGDPTHRESKTLPVLTDTSVWTPGTRVEPTPTEDGSQTYTSEYGNVTITLPAAGHKHEWSDRWSNDEFHHWHECTGAGTCDATNETAGKAYGEHEYNGDDICDICGYDRANASKAPTVTGPAGSNTDGLKEGEIPTGDGAPKLSVTVTDPVPGDSDITYQWYEKDENGVFQPIPGATGPEYTIPENTPAGKHEYVCEVTNQEPDKVPSTVRTDPIAVAVEIPSTWPAHTHSWAQVWISDRGSHWHECEATGCTITGNSEKQGYAAHREDGGRVILEPTEDTPGIRAYQCTVCRRILRTEEIRAKGFEISGTVEKDQMPVEGAKVTLKRGIAELKETTTNAEGRYGFSGVRPGVYNVVAEKDGKTMTILVIITSKDATNRTLTIPSEDVNSILKITEAQDLDGGGVQVNGVVVGGLNQEALERRQAGSTVTVTMTVEKEDETADSTEQSAIKTVAGGAGDSEKKLEFLSIKVEKKVVSETEETPSENINETQRLIEIVIPYNFSGKKDITVYRYHSGAAEALNEGEEQEGTFKLDRTNSLIHIYAKKFSTYAVGYTQEDETSYTLTVTSGEGGGFYQAGETVLIIAEVPSGKRFTRWHIISGDVTLADPTSKETIFTMPGGNVTIEAQFADIVQPGPDKPVPPTPPSSGGSSSDESEPTYEPVIVRPSHGTVTVRPRYPEQGDKVTVTLTPDKGFQADGITVVDRSGRPVTVVDNGDGTYTFTQPRGTVTITASFKPVGGGVPNCPKDMTCPIWPYTDANPTAWYHDGVHYCIEHGLMVGLDVHTFAPEGVTSRAMIAAILWRLEGSPVVNYILSFNDVAEDAWYAEAVRWAAASGIVNGYDDRTFGPNDPITREQLAAILYRYKQYKGSGFTGAWMFPLDFDDANQVSDWAYEPMCWMTMNGIINGVGNNLLNPKGQATRAQVAAMIMRFCTKT